MPVEQLTYAELGDRLITNDPLRFDGPFTFTTPTTGASLGPRRADSPVQL
jgi:hypothetical protein